MRADTEARVFIVLLESSRHCEELIDAIAREPELAGVDVAIAPVRGLRFFDDSAAQPELNRWWSKTIHEGVEPVFFVRHEAELIDWLVGLDGVFVVGGCAGANAYDPTRCIVLPGEAPEDYVDAYLSNAGIALDSSTTASPSRVLQLNDAVRDVPRSPTGSPADLDPFAVLAAMHASPEDGALDVAAGSPTISARPTRRRPLTLHIPRWPQRASARDARRVTDAELAARLIGRGSTIVAVGSRKGGVGKTSHASGMAIVAGTVLDEVGHSAAIVDANVANPDAWGQLNLPGGAATVRDVVAALATNREPPRPVFAATPALACYPESRETSEYSRTDVIRLAHYLRERYSFVVVDMSNRLPDPIAGPEAAVAAYWLEQADCLVLPAASSKQDFNGVLDYLELRDLPPAVVAYLIPGARRNREHPLTKRYLAAISTRAHSVVTLPDEADRVRYAGMEGVPVQDVSPALGNAYRDLVMAVASTPKRRGT